MAALFGLLIALGASQVRATFAARVADPATDPDERARMQSALAKFPDHRRKEPA